MEKAGEDATEKIKSTDDNKHLMEVKEIEVQEKKTELYSKLEIVGNLVHDSVPVSNDEVFLSFSDYCCFSFRCNVEESGNRS